MSENMNKKGSHNARCLEMQWPVGFDYPHLKWYPSDINVINTSRKNADNLIMPPAVVRKAPWRG